MAKVLVNDDLAASAGATAGAVIDAGAAILDALKPDEKVK